MTQQPLPGPPLGRQACQGQAPLRGPDFSTYDAQDVGWLLTDFTCEAAANPLACTPGYLRDLVAAELAPAPYAPSAEYLRLLAKATERHAAQTATAVGKLTEAVLGMHRDPIIVSIMRGGVPIGVLMHRWAAHKSVELPHYAISIVQETGIDATALRWLAENYDPARIVFVDGWTAKGTVATTLSRCLERAHAEHGIRFPGVFGVLADLGHCAMLHGTHEDYLIPSAGLDSTATGLISRSIYHPDLTGPTSFHAAAFHRHLADADTSRAFIETVSCYFDHAVPTVEHSTAPCPADWSGRRAAEAIVGQRRVDHIDLVKPGVCETTRVLVQWRVNTLLIRRNAERELDHVLLLATERGTPIEYFDDMPFACVAVVPPRPVLATAAPARR